MLKELSLGSLAETEAGIQFNEAMEEIRRSMDRDGDVKGPRTITVKLSFTPDDRGFVSADMSVTTATPRRKIKTVAAFEDGKLKIDTISSDATQPFLDNITPIPAPRRA